MHILHSKAPKSYSHLKFADEPVIPVVLFGVELISPIYVEWLLYTSTYF